MLLIALPAAGCAKTEGSSPTEARADNAQNAENEQTELRTQQAEERADLKGEQKKDAADTEETLAKNAAEMKADHAKFEADEKARIDKIDIRLAAVEPKVVKAKGATAAKGILTQVKDRRATLGESVTHLSSNTGDEWDSAMKSLETNTTTLEGNLDELEKLFP